MNTVAKVNSSTDSSKTLASFIRETLKKCKPSFQYSDNNIKSIKTGGGTDAAIFLDEPFSNWGELVCSDDHKKIIDVWIDLVEGAQTQNNGGMYARMLNQIRPVGVEVKSKWCVMDVDSFLSRLADAKNKEEFLKRQRKKPTFNEQIEAVIVGVMKANKLRYIVSAGSDEKATVENALRYTVAVFRDVQKYRERLLRDKVNLFKTPILVAIEKFQSVKAKPGRIPDFTIEQGRDLIIRIDKAGTYWPNRYTTKVGTGELAPRRGEAILSELENAKSIISKHCIYLEEQNVRNDAASRRTESVQPNAKNSSFEIRKTMP